jgi:hypothetical protein
MRLAALAVLATGAVAASASAIAGCGGARDRPPLAWKGRPQAFRSESLPHDRVVLATVRNASSRPLHLDAAKLVVRDAGGHRLVSTAQFVAAFSHGLYGAFQQPSELPPGELTRRGLVVTLRPGASAPLTVAWRLAGDSREPATVDYGSGRLTLPRASR